MGLKDILDRISERSAALGLSDNALSLRAGMSRDGIRNWRRRVESGEDAAGATVNALAAIARELDVTETWLIHGLGDTPPRPPIAVAGLVGAGAQVPLVDAYEKGDGLYHVAAPPQLRNGGKNVVAVQVEGDSMAPTYEPGDVLFYTRDVIGVPSEAIGRKCVVCDEAGDVWLKIVRRRDGQPEGYYDLVSINAEVAPRYDVRLQWAAPVRMALSAEMIERV